jgi:hypothetical protein
MGLDIRIPIGLLFGLLGAILAVFGLFSDRAIYERSLGININIWWGLVLIVFGVAMFVFGRRGASTVRPADEGPEGRKIEEREHRAGLERDSRPRGH